jgi:hypothetical protein
MLTRTDEKLFGQQIPPALLAGEPFAQRLFAGRLPFLSGFSERTRTFNEN